MRNLASLSDFRSLSGGFLGSYSPPLPPIDITTPPSISGAPVVGQVITFNDGAATGEGVTTVVARRLFKDGIQIAYASSISLLLADQGSTFYHDVVWQDDNGTRTARSVSVSVVHAAPTVIGSLPSLAATDVDGPIVVDLTTIFDGEDLTFEISDNPAPAGITRSGNNLTLDPALIGVLPSDTYEVTASNSNPASASDSAAVAITADQAPAAVDDTGFTTEFETPIIITKAALLANDSDPDSGHTPAFDSLGSATGGTLADNGTTITFTPATGFEGAGSFDYTIISNGKTDSATVSITVGPSATAPAQFGASDWGVIDLSTSGDIRVSITALPDDGGSTLTDLQFRADGGAWLTLGGTAIGDYDLAGFPNNTELNIEVRAVNAIGGGPASAIKSVIPTTLEVSTTNGVGTVSNVTGTTIDLTFNPPCRIVGTFTVTLADLATGPVALGGLTWEPGTFDTDGTPELTRPILVGNAADGPISSTFSTTGAGTVVELDFTALEYQPDVADGGNSVTVTETAQNLAGSTPVVSAGLTIDAVAPAGPLMADAGFTTNVAANNLSSIALPSVVMPAGAGNGLLTVALYYSTKNNTSDPATIIVNDGTSNVTVTKHVDTFDNGATFHSNGVAFFTASVPYGATVTVTAQTSGTNDFSSEMRVGYMIGDAVVVDARQAQIFGAALTVTANVPADGTVLAGSMGYIQNSGAAIDNAGFTTKFQDPNWDASAVDGYVNGLAANAAYDVDMSRSDAGHHFSGAVLTLEAA